MPQQTKPEGQVTPHFSWAEVLYLPKWSVWHEPTEEERANLTKLCLKMEQVRELLGEAINVSCAIRPSYVQAPGTFYNGKNYNILIGGAANSAHIKGLAMDFTVSRMTCDEARMHLEPQLEALNLRMERKSGSGWVHLDLYPVLPGHQRYFTP